MSRGTDGDVALAEGQTYRAGARRVRVQAVDVSSGVPRAVVVEVFPSCPGETAHALLGGACCARKRSDTAPFAVQTTFSRGAWHMPAAYALEG